MSALPAPSAVELRPGSPESRAHWRRVHIAGDRSRPLPELFGALFAKAAR